MRVVVAMLLVLYVLLFVDCQLVLLVGGAVCCVLFGVRLLSVSVVCVQVTVGHGVCS